VIPYISRAEYDKLKAEHEELKEEMAALKAQMKEVMKQRAPVQVQPTLKPVTPTGQSVEELTAEVKTLKQQVEETIPGSTRFLLTGTRAQPLLLSTESIRFMMQNSTRFSFGNWATNFCLKASWKSHSKTATHTWSWPLQKCPTSSTTT
jgi:hypothetical protein